MPLKGVSLWLIAFCVLGDRGSDRPAELALGHSSRKVGHASPLVTFVLPVFNRSFVVKDAVRGLLDLGLRFPFEIIAVDNESCDNTYALLKKCAKDKDNFLIQHLDDHRDAVEALNIGVSLARGGYICPLTVDCFFDHSLEKAIAVLERGEADAVLLRSVSLFRDFDRAAIVGRLRILRGTSALSLYDLLGNSVPDQLELAGCVFTRASWLRVGGYSAGQGYNLWGFLFKLLAGGCRVCVCDDSGVIRRQWTRKEELIPLWDYDANYGIPREPSCKLLYALAEQNRDLFMGDFLAKKPKTNDINKVMIWLRSCLRSPKRCGLSI